MKKYVLSLLVLLVGTPCFGMNLSDIRTTIRRLVRDNGSAVANRRYSDAELRDFINEGQKEINSLLAPCQKTTSYVLTGGVTYYNLPPDFLNIDQAYFDDRQGNRIELEEKSRNGLVDYNIEWEKDSGEPTTYLIEFATSAVQNSTRSLRIGYTPTPVASTTTASTGTVTLWYYFQFADVSADSDLPFDGMRHLFPYHYILVYYTAMRCMLMEGITDEASAYGKMYQNYLAVMDSRMKQMPNYNPSMKVDVR